MSPTAPARDEGRLLEELGWLRALAHRLCADAHAADDAVQDTMVAALRRPPDPAEPVRGWLATVLVNAVRAARRGAARRDARERLRAAARDEAVPSAAAMAERIELQHALLDAVQQLPPVLREAVVLRYLEALPPRRIAARLCVPVATVKARLQRGHAELRRRLDGRHGGGRRAWVALLLRAWPRVGSGLGAMTMGKKILFGGGAVVLAAVLGVVVPDLLSPPPPAPEAAAVPAVARGERAGPPAQPAGDAGERTAAAVPAGADAPAAAPPAQAVVAGRVLDVRGAPLPGIVVRCDGDDARATTDAAGRFELATRGRGGWVRTDDPGWVTMLAGTDRAGARESLVVAARAIRLAGRVADAQGTPVAQARLQFVEAPTLRASLPLVLDDSNSVDFEATSDAVGAFAMPPLPAIEGSRIRVQCDGYVPRELPLPIAGDAALLVTLERPARGGQVLAGSVVDRHGRPVAGALVGLGRRTTRSAADGTFALDLGDGTRGGARDGAAELVALKKGHLPGRVAALRAGPEDASRWPSPLVVPLGGDTLAIEGRVLAADGAPRAGVRVWINALELLGDVYEVENELRGAPKGWQHVTTGADGRFRIDGLRPRDYHVTTLDGDTALRVDAEHVAAGTTDLVLQFDANGLLPEVHGRVVDRTGQPLAAIDVRVTTDAYVQWRGGYATGVWNESGATARTDRDGRFTIRGMPKQRAYLRFDGDDVLPAAIGDDQAAWPFAPGDEVRVTMLRRCHLQVELLDAATADSLAVEDGHGVRVKLTSFEGGGSMSAPTMAIHDGRSSALATSDDAQTLVLYRGTTEVRRVPIVLVPGQLTTLRY